MGGKTAAQFIADQPELYTGGAEIGNAGYQTVVDGVWEIYRDVSGTGTVTLLAEAPAYTWYEIQLTMAARGVDTTSVDIRVPSGTGTLLYAVSNVPPGVYQFFVRTGNVSSNINIGMPNINVGGFYSNISIKKIPGFHAIAPSDAARPLYQTAGGLHWLAPDGVDDWMQVLPVCDLGETWSHVGGWTANTSTRRAFATSNAFQGALYANGPNWAWRNAAATFEVITSNGITSPHVLTIEQLNTNALQAALNGVQSAAIVPWDDSAAIQGLALFTENNSLIVQPHDGRFYGGTWINRALTTTERANTETYIAGLTGVTL